MRVENGVPVEYAGTSIASGEVLLSCWSRKKINLIIICMMGRGIVGFYLQAGVETEVVWEDQNFVIQSGMKKNRLLETWREMERDKRGSEE